MEHFTMGVSEVENAYIFLKMVRITLVGSKTIISKVKGSIKNKMGIFMRGNGKTMCQMEKGNKFLKMGIGMWEAI